MSEIKLLPCPICSREVYIGTEDYDDNIEDVIVCDHCNLRFYGSYPATKQDLAEEWNTRKPMERIIERLNEKEDLAIKEMNELDNDKYASEYECGFAGGESSAFCNAIRIVKEEGGIE